MHKPIGTFLIVTTALIAPLLCPGCKSDELETTRKPVITYYTVTDGDKKIGYQTEEFRIEDGKAITEVHSYLRSTFRSGPTRWISFSTQRHTETLDGRPLSQYAQLPGHHKTIVTIEKDQKMRIKTTYYTRKDQDQKPPSDTTIECPPDGLFPHGLHLLTERKGLKEGTKFTSKIFFDNKWGVLHSQVGPRQKIDINGRDMELTKLNHSWEVPTDDPKSVTTLKMTSYVNEDLIGQKIILHFGPNPWTLTACSKDEAMKPPAPTRPQL